MQPNIIKRVWRQDKMVNVDVLNGFTFTDEEEAHRFIISGKNVNTPVDISGTITANFKNADGVLVPLTGTIEDGKAVVVLSRECYAVEGPFSLMIFADTVCIYAAIANVINSSGEVIAYPTATIPSVQEMIDELREIQSSWPADYTSLQNDVSGLKKAVASGVLAPERMTGMYITSTGVMNHGDTQTTFRYEIKPEVYRLKFKTYNSRRYGFYDTEATYGTELAYFTAIGSSAPNEDVIIDNQGYGYKYLYVYGTTDGSFDAELTEEYEIELHEVDIRNDEWSMGQIGTGGRLGELIDSDSRCRSPYYYIGNFDYYVSADSKVANGACRLSVIEYDENMLPINGVFGMQGRFRTSQDARYIRLVCRNIENTSFTSDDIDDVVSDVHLLIDCPDYERILKPYRCGTGCGLNFIEALKELENYDADKVLYVQSGTYDIFTQLGGTTYLATITSESTAYNIGLPALKKGKTRIVGVGNVVLNYMPELDTVSPYPYAANLISVLNIYGNAEIENITINARYCRYCVHDETQGLDEYKGTVKSYKNCVFTHYAKLSSSQIGGATIGGGCDNAQSVTIENCRIVNENGANAVSWHNRNGIGGCVFNFVGTEFVTSGNNALRFGNVLKHPMNFVYIVSCYLNKPIYLNPESGDSNSWVSFQLYISNSSDVDVIIDNRLETNNAEPIIKNAVVTKSATDAIDDRVTALEAGAIGDMDLETFNRCIVMGIGAKVGPVGTALTVEKETGLSVTVGTSGSGTAGVTGATVNEITFINRIGHSDPGAYEFTYDGAAWHLDGAAVELSQYGITPTGTAAAGDMIVVHVSASAIMMNVLDHDYHTPANSAIPHTCTIGMRDCFENWQFDAPEALIKVVDGLAAGSHFYLTLYKGAYGGGTGQDGTYGGTLGEEQAIPAGGYLRHTTMGVYQSRYNASQITGGKWIAYDTSFNQIGAQIATDSGDTTGTNFGTATASTYQGNSEHVNFTERNAYGCNRVDQSAWLQYANAEGTGWWSQKNEWDFPQASVATIKGFLTGLDPVMKAAMVKTKIRVALPNCDGGGYKDIETYVFPMSMTEVGFGANNSQYETSWGLNNTLKTTALAFYQGATNADRTKKLAGAARYWFLRGPHPSYACLVRIVHTDGSLNSYGYASSAYGFVAAWVIGNPVIASA